jgi:hypothetical protein
VRIAAELEDLVSCLYCAPRPIPGLSVPHIPHHPLDLSTKKAQQRASKKSISRSEEVAEEDRGEGSSQGVLHPDVSAKGKTQEPELDTATYQPELSRKQRAKVRPFRNRFTVWSLIMGVLSDQQPQPKSASQEWASLPSIPSSLLPQMKRDYQAMNLANSLDPKRFMKGGKKSTKIPENFAVSLLESESTISGTDAVPGHASRLEPSSTLPSVCNPPPLQRNANTTLALSFKAWWPTARSTAMRNASLTSSPAHGWRMGEGKVGRRGRMGIGRCIGCIVSLTMRFCNSALKLYRHSAHRHLVRRFSALAEGKIWES